MEITNKAEAISQLRKKRFKIHTQTLLRTALDAVAAAIWIPVLMSQEIHPIVKAIGVGLIAMVVIGFVGMLKYWSRPKLDAIYQMESLLEECEAEDIEEVLESVETILECM